MKDNELKKLISTYQKENSILANKLLKLTEENMLNELDKNQFVDEAGKQITQLKNILNAMDAQDSNFFYSNLRLFRKTKILESVDQTQSTTQAIQESINNGQIN
jgi:hypothetical protein